MAKRKQRDEQENVNIWDEIAEAMKNKENSSTMVEEQVIEERAEDISPYYLDDLNPDTKQENTLVVAEEQDSKKVSTTVDHIIDQIFIGADVAKQKTAGLFYTLKCQWELRAQPKLAGGLQSAGKKAKDLSRFISRTAKRLAQRWELKERLHQAKVVIFRIDELRDYAEHNKKKLLVGFGLSVAGVAAITLVLGSMTSYEYLYNDRVLGVVKNQQDVYEVVELAGDKLASAYRAEIMIDKDEDISFHRVFTRGRELDSKDDILNRLTYMKEMKATGYGIYVDRQLMAVVDSEASAKNILDEMKSQYVSQEANVQYERIDFAEKVEVKSVETKLGSLQKKEDVMEYMLTGAVEKKIHAVQSGETFSSIAKLYGMSQKELTDANPEVIPEKLQINQEISLIRPAPVATVETVEIVTYCETIPFEVAYEDTNTLYKGEQTVKSQGNNGEREVQARIVRSNGIETEKVELSSTVVSAPTAQVVLQGTKEQPALVGTGKFIYPTRGRLTSKYGSRWGRMHKGIDLAAPTGTAIKAADGGTVISAGYNGSLGYMVKIDHGGGKVTLYGHCSKLLVKSGQKVYQGQHIANVGNTGNSTGPHLHFEVHVNGNTKNPLSYLP